MKAVLCLLALALSLPAIAGNTSTLYMNYGGYNRDFIVHLPTGYVAGQHLPLVFNFHGYTSNASQQELYTKMDATADANHFIVVYPDGINNEWNVGWAGTYGTGIDDVGFTGKLIDTMVVLYGINTDRVYATGLSNGGYLSHRLACEMSNRIAAIAAVSGCLTDSTAFYCHPQRLMPIMHIHGTADPIVPYNGLPGALSTEAAINFWLNKETCNTPGDTTNLPDTNSSDGCTVQTIDYNQCSANNEVLLYKITGGGHTWPDGLVDISNFGNTDRDFDASQAIWDFFNRYTLSGTTDIKAIENAAHVKIYPNPFGNSLQIEAAQILRQIEVFNMLGERLIVKQVNSNTGIIDTRYLPAGAYLLKVSGKDFIQNKVITKY
ncbi:MAG TPA: T9SS type A sorting domain-containing protein [Chitinophagales bacterium]|nr:T9SS type A sorting domain-containing protein [Chitinophagales bacterium]